MEGIAEEVKRVTKILSDSKVQSTIFDQPQMSQEQEVESVNLAQQTPNTNPFISQHRSNAHLESSNRLEVPQGFSPHRIFNIEIKNHE